jgi:hypothetical protein
VNALLLLIGWCKSMGTISAPWLRAEGIGASVQREFLRRAAGELPPDQCQPEVWIDDDGLETQALKLLRILRQAPQRRFANSCGKLVEGGFQQCRSCGAMMPL